MAIEYPVVVLANIPPDIDPLAASIDKTAVREAIRALLLVALPHTKVHVLTNQGDAIEKLCISVAVACQLSAEQANNLSIDEPNHCANILTAGCHFFLIGGGLTDLISVEYACKTQREAGRGKERFKVHPIASTGGLAEKFYQIRAEAARASGEEPNQALLDDLVYDALFRDILGLSPLPLKG